MESSKKASDYFGTFQYVRSGINAKNARDRFWRRMRIYIIRNRMEEGGMEEEGEEMRGGRGEEGGKQRGKGREEGVIIAGRD